MIHDSSYVDKGASIGEGTSIWHFCHIMSTARIGAQCTLGQNVFIGNDVIIGNNVKIQNNVSLYTGVHVEDDVFIGPSAVFTNVINPRSFVNRKSEFKPTIMKKGCTIGANATILCGVTIGEYAFIGAGTVVLENIPNYGLIVGNPSRQIGWMSQAGSKLMLDANNHGTCPISGQDYQLKDGNLCPLS